MFDKGKTELIRYPAGKVATSYQIPTSVTSVSDGAFTYCCHLKTIAIPKGITKFTDWVFMYCDNLEDVYYTGTEAQWNAIEIGHANDALINATKHYNAEIHDFGAWTVTKAATCTETGLRTRACTDAGCSKVETAVIPALGHTEAVDAAKAATCTETGLTEGKHCSVCGAILTVQEKTDALGHAWDNGKVTKEPTETETGVKTFTCTRCGETKTEVIPATGSVDVTKMFTDVSHSWAYDGIQYCVTHQLMSGIGNDLFGPKLTTTRAQIVQILYNLQGSPKVSGTTPFTDLTNDWYQDAVLWAYQTGVVAGTSSTTFEPDRPVTREQIAVILMEYVTRVLKLERTWTPADLSAFPDAGSVSDWAKDALADAVALGLISGASNGGQTYLEPQGSATREQVATILMEFCKNVKK